jgi:hypothetical protein
MAMELPPLKQTKTRKPNGRLRKPNSNKNCVSTTGNKAINCASPTKHLPSRTPLKKKTAKAQQGASKAQLQQKAAQARRETEK